MVHNRRFVSDAKSSSWDDALDEIGGKHCKNEQIFAVLTVHWAGDTVRLGK